MTYRGYQSGDESRIVELWNMTLRQDPITSQRFRNLVLLDANFDPEGLRLAFIQGELVGVVYAIRRILPMKGMDLELQNGWISFFFVKDQQRRKGVATRLLQDALQFLKENGREKVYFSAYAPSYILPGIDARTYPEGYQFLLRKGFTREYSPIAMDYSLNSFVVPLEVRALKEQRMVEGYQFRAARDSDLYELIQFATNVFNPDWGRAIREGILQGLPISRILVARDKEKIVGFCMYGAYERIPERFGPFGVDPALRGSGLGKILLYDCLEAMKAEGLHGAWFLWTGETTSAGYLYKKVGFKKTREFYVMSKGLV